MIDHLRNPIDLTKPRLLPLKSLTEGLPCGREHSSFLTVNGGLRSEHSFPGRTLHPPPAFNRGTGSMSAIEQIFPCFHSDRACPDPIELDMKHTHRGFYLRKESTDGPYFEWDCCCARKKNSCCSSPHRHPTNPSHPDFKLTFSHIERTECGTPRYVWFPNDTIKKVFTSTSKTNATQGRVHLDSLPVHSRKGILSDTHRPTAESWGIPEPQVHPSLHSGALHQCPHPTALSPSPLLIPPPITQQPLQIRTHQTNEPHFFNTPPPRTYSVNINTSATTPVTVNSNPLLATHPLPTKLNIKTLTPTLPLQSSLLDSFSPRDWNRPPTSCSVVTLQATS